MYRFPKPEIKPPPTPPPAEDIYDEIRWGYKVEGDHPLLNDEGELYTDATEMWWNTTNKVIVELVKR
jgi:hypothetical protein